MVRLALTRVFLILYISASAQGGNPYEADRTAIRVGRALFETRCAQCHGGDAQGISGPDLTLLWAIGTNDDRVFQSIQLGVSGSIMPSSSAPDQEIWAIVAYLKSLGSSGRRNSTVLKGFHAPPMLLDTRLARARGARKKEKERSGFLMSPNPRESEATEGR